MIHVYIERGTRHVAMIHKQHPAADGYQPQLPWLLLLDDGRVRRHPSQPEARDEAQKRFSPVTFKRT